MAPYLAIIDNAVWFVLHQLAERAVIFEVFFVYDFFDGILKALFNFGIGWAIVVNNIVFTQRSYLGISVCVGLMRPILCLLIHLPPPFNFVNPKFKYRNSN